ncbi:MAG: dihydrofolate reductase family protein [Gemmatimonadota bacterium]|nr:dihydrofolate reductase family protein [Gemmatimonadota bacterium]
MKSDRRPYILLNYALSLDGKLSTEQRDPVRFTSRVDRGLMDEIRADADAVLIGAGTLRAEDPPVRIKSARRREERRRKGKSPHPVSVILSRSMRLPGAGRYWEDGQVERIIATTEQAKDEQVLPFQDLAEVIRVGRTTVDLHELCRMLSGRGIGRLLVEGGGEVNMAFWEAGLVDEVYLTLCPVVIGGSTAPTAADGKGFASDRFRRLRLIESRRVGQELFLRYRAVRSKP